MIPWLPKLCWILSFVFWEPEYWEQCYAHFPSTRLKKGESRGALSGNIHLCRSWSVFLRHRPRSRWKDSANKQLTTLSNSLLRRAKTRFVKNRVLNCSLYWIRWSFKLCPLVSLVGVNWMRSLPLLVRPFKILNVSAKSPLLRLFSFQCKCMPCNHSSLSNLHSRRFYRHSLCRPYTCDFVDAKIWTTLEDSTH